MTVMPTFTQLTLLKPFPVSGPTQLHLRTCDRKRTV